MYSHLLATHSIVRWVVLFALVLIVLVAFYKLKAKKKHTQTDKAIRIVTTSILHLQLALGYSLYLISPIVQAFYANFSKNIHQRQIRFFGMEHITVMTIAIAIITIGSVKVKRKNTDQEKFKTTFIWFLIGLILILSSIPWSFSP